MAISQAVSIVGKYDSEVHSLQHGRIPSRIQAIKFLQQTA